MNVQPVFRKWCVVEIMGHQTLAGLVTEESWFGTTLLRIDVPQTSTISAWSRLYGAAAVYSVTAVEEDVARAYAESLRKQPIEEWRIGNLLREKVQEADDEYDRRDPLD